MATKFYKLRYFCFGKMEVGELEMILKAMSAYDEDSDGIKRGSDLRSWRRGRAGREAVEYLVAGDESGDV